MKIIDRYVLSMFAKNYLISFMVLIGMYIALDMVFNFSNLTQNHNTSIGSALSIWHILYDIVDFYFYQSFLYFVQLSGMIAVLAAGFTVMRLSRFNEMTALLAAGTPLLRVALSVVLAGVVLNLVLLPIDQEIIIPRMIPKLMREHGDVHETTIKAFAVRMMQDDFNGLFNAAQYSPPSATAPAHIDYLDVIERDADLRPSGHLYAAAAFWNSSKQRWDLTDGHETPITPPSQSRTPGPKTVAFYKSNITPEEIALNDLGKDYIQLLPTLKIDQLLDPSRAKSYGTIDLLRTKHLRFTQPIANVILLLLTISTVLSREPGTFKTGAAKCMVLTTLCTASVFIAYQLAATPPNASWINIWPALMAWLPILIFGPLTAYLLDHMKS
ncbi:MAG: LptF/LptG family permease [Planctomycetota bacterium]|nr:LptF/LptG family permease [Planctomycetota bacterium]